MEPPAKKAAAAKRPAAKAPARKAPAKKTAAKKTPAAKVAPAPASPAPEAGPETPAAQPFGRGHGIPLSLGLAVAGLVAIALSRLRRD